MEYTIKDFEVEIKKIDPLFSILPNPNNLPSSENPVGLNNIFYDGKNYDLPVCADVIKDTIDPGYRYTFRNGYASRFWAYDEIIARLHSFLEMLKSGKLKEDYE